MAESARRPSITNKSYPLFKAKDGQSCHNQNQKLSLCWWHVVEFLNERSLLLQSISKVRWQVHRRMWYLLFKKKNCMLQILLFITTSTDCWKYFPKLHKTYVQQRRKQNEKFTRYPALKRNSWWFDLSTRTSAWNVESAWEIPQYKSVFCFRCHFHPTYSHSTTPSFKKGWLRPILQQLTTTQLCVVLKRNWPQDRQYWLLSRRRPDR